MAIKNENSSNLAINNVRVKYRVLNVKHLQSLQNKIDELNQDGKISQHETLQYYIGKFNFQIPENFPEAKSIIVLALEKKLVLVNFLYNGEKYEVMVPPNYCSSGVSDEEINNFVLTEIIKEKGFRVEQTRNLHLKFLAVRSGLGKYGKNNICYVDELGSFPDLFAIFTDYEFPDGDLEEVKMLNRCEKCSVCIEKCPTHCISQENFIINVDNCIPLYNEIRGEFPDFIKDEFHNALIGCMKCQMYCPENREVMKNVQRYDDIQEEQTKAILDGKDGDKLINTLGHILKFINSETAEYYLPVFKRNLEVLLK
ncbi:MAG: epoxyqueuosine reductase [Asgard group archaeon]|nr:epoxyqueuosine reductase [Asgard group archaeon]